MLIGRKPGFSELTSIYYDKSVRIRAPNKEMGRKQGKSLDYTSAGLKGRPLSLER